MVMKTVTGIKPAMDITYPNMPSTPAVLVSFAPTSELTRLLIAGIDQLPPC